MFSRQEFEIVVAELNNQGVISIGANDINGAITTFERGLRCLSLMLLEQTPFETLKVGERADTCNVRPIPGLVGSGGFGSVSTAFGIPSSSVLPDEAGDAVQDASQTPSKVCVIENTSSNIFKHGVLIQSKHSYEIMSAILIFNLGMAFHCQSSQSELNICFRKKLHRKAGALYEKSFALVSSTRLEQPCPVVDLLIMAILNNLIHIHVETTNFMEAQQCMESLVVYSMSTLNSSRYQDTNVAKNIRDIAEEFLSSATILIKKNAAGAA